MSDLDAQLRAYFDETTVRVSTTEATSDPSSGQRGGRDRRLLAMAAALVVVAAVGLSWLALRSDDRDDLRVVAPETTVPSTSSAPATSQVPVTTSAAPATSEVSTPPTSVAPPLRPTDTELLISALIDVLELEPFAAFELVELARVDEVPLLPRLGPEPLRGFHLELYSQTEDRFTDISAFAFDGPDDVVAFLDRVRGGECDDLLTVPPCPAGEDHPDPLPVDAPIDEQIVMLRCGRGCSTLHVVRVDRWLIAKRANGDTTDVAGQMVSTLARSLLDENVADYELVPSATEELMSVVINHGVALMSDLGEVGFDVFSLAGPAEGCQVDGFNPDDDAGLLGTGQFVVEPEGRIRMHAQPDPILIPADDPRYLAARNHCDRFSTALDDYGGDALFAESVPQPIISGVRPSEGAPRLVVSGWRYELPPGLVAVVFPGLDGGGLEINQFSMVVDGSRTRMESLELWATGSSRELASAFDLELDAAWSGTTATLHFDMRVWVNETDALHEFGSMMGIDPFTLGLAPA